MPDSYAIPMLPCRDVDEMLDFYGALGSEKTYRQTRPNPYLAMRRDDLPLHFFGIEGFDPEQSYGTCGLIVPDTGELYDDFAAGMRARYGKVLVSGTPRMTRPRKRWNVGGHAGFSVIDPGGNWIRIFAHQAAGAEPDPTAPAGASTIARAVGNAVVIADSHGDEAQAAKILDSKLLAVQDQHREVPPDDLAEAVLYRAELAVRLNDPDTARIMVDRFQAMDLCDVDQGRTAEFKDQADLLVEQLR